MTIDYIPFRTRASLLILCCCTLLFSFPCHAKKQKQNEEKYRICAAAIFSNEGPYLKEWIEYHRLIGIEHFYLYNHLSTDNFREVLAPYIQNGTVDLIEWPRPASNWQEWDPIQVDAYRDALKRAKRKTEWLAIIDIDEYIVPVAAKDLRGALRKYENDAIGGVCCIWSFFGTSRVEKIPQDKLLIETLLCHSGPASHGDLQSIWNQGSYKSIVRPAFVSGISSPHYCHYVEGRHHEMLPYDKLRINHYWTRDNDYLIHSKIPRRKAWGQDSSSVLAWAEGMNGLTEDNAILRFVDKLKKTMFTHTY